MFPLSESDSERLRYLQSVGDADEPLSSYESAELEVLFAKIDAAKHELLAPADARLQAEIERLAARNQALRALVERDEAVVERLQAALRDAQAEHAISSHCASVRSES